MAAPLIEYTREEKLPVIGFLSSGNEESSETKGRVTVQYGDNCLNQFKF